MPTNQELLTRGDRKYAAKKRTKQGGEAAVYDPDARSEYLSGFHKRKLRRQEDAKKKAQDWEKAQKLKEKQENSVEKRKAIQRGLERLQDAQKIFNGGSLDSDDEGAAGAAEEGEGEEEEFTGFEDTSGILKRRQQEYGDESVTIEEISVDPYVDLSRGQEVLESSTRKANEYAEFVEKAERSERKQAQRHQLKRKKKFRYRR